MLRTMGRRTAALLAVAVALVATSCTQHNQPTPAAYCAIMPDSVGLYVGNPVTQMGYQIGKVQKIAPGPTSTRVDFTLSDSESLPADVKAVIRSASILADRALEMVGNYDGGPELRPDQCVPLGRSMTPKSLSQTLDAANTFINGMTPQDSTNLQDVVAQSDRALANNGEGISRLLSASSRLLDNPDQAVSDLTAIVQNLADLTDMMVADQPMLSQMVRDGVVTMPYIEDTVTGTRDFVGPLEPVVTAMTDFATHITDELQLTLDTFSDVIRINTPHARGIASLLDPLPWWINTAANHVNNHVFSMSYRPPLYRVRSPNGPFVCAVMNVANPGSCANVAGQPYGVDINLLQYVFMEATR